MRPRRLLAGALVVALTPVVVLGVEVGIASRGAPAGDVPPGRDGCVGCGPDRPRPEHVVWLGDSTAAGVGVERAEEVLAQQVGARLGRPVQITNLAVSGDTVEDTLRDQLPLLGAADVVAVSVGANDVTHLTRTGTFRQRYRRLLRGLPDSVRVVVLGIPDMGSPPRLAQPLRAVSGWRGRRLDRIVREEAERAGARYVDIAGSTGPRFRADRSLFADDGYHPSARGYALWADAVVARWP